MVMLGEIEAERSKMIARQTEGVETVVPIYEAHSMVLQSLNYVLYLFRPCGVRGRHKRNSRRIPEP